MDGKNNVQSINIPATTSVQKELLVVHAKYVIELKAGENPSTYIYVNQSSGFQSMPLLSHFSEFHSSELLEKL